MRLIAIMILSSLAMGGTATAQQFTVEVVQPVPQFVVVVEQPRSTKPAGKQRYLVSEPWCLRCPARKQLFIANGWPESNIITIEEAHKRFGFFVPHVPYEFLEPEPTPAQPAIAASPPVSYQSVRQGGNCPGGVCPTVRTVTRTTSSSRWFHFRRR